MGYRFKGKYHPNKREAEEFSVKIQEIERFCKENGIKHSVSYDSFYFSIEGIEYRVSNHSVEASNSKAYNEFGDKIRDVYHPEGRREGVVYIHASKLRIIQIYNDLKAGYRLDGRGNRIKDN